MEPTTAESSGAARRGEAASADPSLQEAAEVAGDRWVLLALGALRDGARRFGDLAGDMPGIAPNILIDRLRRMERHGLIVASPYSQRPRRYVYDLTESGRELATVLPALACWAARRSGAVTVTHVRCGTPLEVRLWCPTCGATVDDIGHEVHTGPAVGDPATSASHTEGDNVRWL